MSFNTFCQTKLLYYLNFNAVELVQNQYNAKSGDVNHALSLPADKLIVPTWHNTPTVHPDFQKPMRTRIYRPAQSAFVL